MIGHNTPSFDAIVEENLQRGLLLSIKDAFVSLSRDPRAEKRHLRVLAEIIDCMNTSTKGDGRGMAWPGRKRLAAMTADVLRPTGYSEATIAKTIQELIGWGFLVHDRRAPAGGGRALSHYTIARPSVEDLQGEIEAWVQQQRAADRRRPFPAKGERALSGSLSESGHSPTARLDGEAPLPISADGERALSMNDGERALSIKNPDGECVLPADGERALPTVSSQEELARKIPPKPPSEDPALTGEPAPHKPPAAAGSALDAQFEEFWRAFPPGRKFDKGDCRDLFRSIASGRHKKRRASAETMIEAARAYAASKPDPQYTPAPKTWLNGGRWEDDIPGRRRHSAPDAEQQRLHDMWADAEKAMGVEL